MTTDLDIQNILVKRFGILAFDKKEIQVDCPFCDGGKKLWINIDKRLVHCFKCNYGSGIKKFLSSIGESVDESVKPNWDSVKKSASIVDHVKAIIGDGPLAKTSSSVGKLELPKEIRHFDKLGEMGRQLFAYLQKRGISMSHVHKYKLGYCPFGKYARRIIIPCYMRGELVYFQGRAGYAYIQRKYMNPAVSKAGVLFNYDNLIEGSRAVIVEGTFDAMKIGDGAIAILGKTMSAQQKKELTRKRPSEIVVFLDPDALDDAIALAKELSIIAEVRVVTQHKTDAGSMTQEQNQAFISAAETPNIVMHVGVIVRTPR